MLSVSGDYTTNIISKSRATKGIVIIDFVQETEYPFATVTAGGTNKDQLADGRYISSLNSYTSEDATPLIPSNLGNTATGWVGAQTSNGSGVLGSNEVITLEYNTTYSVRNFWIIGDSTNYPTAFTIEAYYSSAWHTLKTETDNTNFNYVYNHSSTLSITKFRLTITKISAISSKPKLYECGAVISVVFEDKDIVSFNLLEESSANSDKPMGNVSSNVFDIELLNLNKWFTANNTTSPYYNHMKPRKRIRPFLGLSVASDVYESIPLGTFWNDDWDVDSNNMTFKVTAYDKLKSINEETLTTIRVSEGMTIKELLEQILIAFDFQEDDYDIDSNLDQVITYGWLNGSKFRDTLQSISEAGNCSISMDRKNKLIIKSNITAGSSLETWQDTDMIFDINNPFNYSSAFSKATIKANVPRVSLKEVLKLNDIVVATGTKTLSNIGFAYKPTLNITNVSLVSSTNVTITSVTYTASDITIVLSNSGAEETINILAMGNVVEFSEIPVTYDSGADFNKHFELANQFIQDTDTADTYANTIVTMLSDPAATIETNARCNPALEVNDILTLHSPTDKIENAKVVIVRQELTWDGALSGKLTTRKVT